MSRLHEALKKAEQQKAENGSPLDLERPTVIPGDGKGAAAPPPAELPSGAAELRVLLMERCSQSLWNPDRKMMLFFDRRNPVVGVEEFRTLRSHLTLIREQQPLQCLLVTSPLPSEGKTVVAANLAQVLVQQREQRVLLVDSDLRYSRMHLSLGASRSPGLSDYLSGAKDELAILQRGPLENLFFIAGGKAASNPTELIGNGRLRLLLRRLSPAFDWIIMDSPPVIPVSDAKLLAEYLDGVLIVVQSDATPHDLARKACQEFASKKIVGVVLNRVKPEYSYGSQYYATTPETKK